MSCDMETARAELNRWAEAVDLDLDTGTDEEDRDDVEQIVKWISCGWVTVDEDTLRYTMRAKDAPFASASFSEPTGATMRALDKGGRGDSIGKLQAFVAALIGQPQASISKCKRRDLRVLTKVASLFLG